jgi:hypothetical protein
VAYYSWVFTPLKENIELLSSADQSNDRSKALSIFFFYGARLIKLLLIDLLNLLGKFIQTRDTLLAHYEFKSLHLAATKICGGEMETFELVLCIHAYCTRLSVSNKLYTTQGKKSPTSPTVPTVLRRYSTAKSGVEWTLRSHQRQGCEAIFSTGTKADGLC